MIKRIFFTFVGSLILFSFAGLSAEETALIKLIDVVFQVPSPTGYEEPLVEAIKEILPPSPYAKRDNLGSVYWKREDREAGVAVCTPMDEAGYFVSGINPQGYLRIDKAVSGPSLIDSYHLGHPMIVWTGKGPIEGVLALPSLHILSSEVRQEFQERPSLELAYLDIGVNSQPEAQEKGVALLDAVTPWRDMTRLAAGKMAGYSIGRKLCTALVLDAARRSVAEAAPSNPAFVWMAQTKILLRRSRPPSALGAFRASQELGAGNIVVIDVIPCSEEDPSGIRTGRGPVLVHVGESGAGLLSDLKHLAEKQGIPVQLIKDNRSPVMLPFLSGHGNVIGLFLPAKFAQTPAEVVDVEDADALGSLLLALLKEGDL